VSWVAALYVFSIVGALVAAALTIHAHRRMRRVERERERMRRGF
jgi:hypothetical protein